MCQRPIHFASVLFSEPPSFRNGRAQKRISNLIRQIREATMTDLLLTRTWYSLAYLWGHTNTLKRGPGKLVESQL